MTLEERIEAAAKAFEPSAFERYYPNVSSGEVERQIEIHAAAKRAIGAAFPELFSTPPQSWLAPWEADEGMKRAVSDGEFIDGIILTGEGAAQTYTAMRDSHISRKTG